MTTAIDEAKLLLRSEGYVVIPRERHRLLQTHTIIRPDYMPQPPESYLDYIWRTMASKIGHSIVDEGACIKHDATVSDPVTGTERVLRLGVAVVMPREDNDKR